MDKSKKYIEMCEKAEKIQQLWQPNAGDWFLEKSTLPLEIIIFEGWYVLRKDKFIQRIGPANNYDFFDKGKVEIWLPRQDQLQEMSGLPWWEFDERCNSIRRVLLEDPLSETEVETKEEAGLCVVMEKYNKIWNDKEWVNDS